MLIEFVFSITCALLLQRTVVNGASGIALNSTVLNDWGFNQNINGNRLDLNARSIVSIESNVYFLNLSI